MVKIAKLFQDRFDSIMQTDDGTSLCCNECAETFKFPSPIDALREGNMETDYTEATMDFIERLLEHLDQCQPTDEATD